MTDKTALVNLALQSFGSRTTVTAAELVAESSNEAIQANLTFENTRDGLLRMAPWDCGLKTANLIYITSTPGTPENTSPATALWQPGQPRPPWAYEYQYPVDCLRACWVIPASQTGYTGGVPITTAVTGGSPTTWLGGPIVFKVATDSFLMVTTPTVPTPGIGYAVGDLIYSSVGFNNTIVTNKLGTFAINQPQGAGAVYRVLTINGSGGVTSVECINQVIDSIPARTGSYFYAYTTVPAVTFTTTGAGSGVVIGTDLPTSDVYTQRVILTNQEFATLVYVRQVTDPNVWDPLFQDAFTNALGADLVMALNGDKGLANGLRSLANNAIAEARKADGNEGLTINDVIPDWIRIRGIDFNSQYQGVGTGFDWGGYLPMFN